MSKQIITTQEGLEKKIKQMKRKKQSEHNAKTKLNVFYGILLGLLIVYVICLLLPLVWSLLTSVKNQIADFDKNPIGFPMSFEWNYGYVFSNFTLDVQVAGVTGSVKAGMIQMYLYSIFYSVGCSFVAILVPCLTAYLCAKFNYRFNKVIVSIVIVTMTIPIIGALPAGLKMSRDLGLMNHIWGMWIQSGSFLGSNFLVFTTMWKGVPKDFTEAAKVDGASNWRILLQIMIPLAKNTFLTLMLISFIGTWNDYMTPYLYMRSYPTAAYGLYMLNEKNTSGTEGNSVSLGDVTVKMASAMTLVLPMLVIFCIFQKRLVGNLSMGGVKG